MANVQRGIPAQGAVPGPPGTPGGAPGAVSGQPGVPVVVSRAGMIPGQQQQIVLTRPGLTAAGMPAGIRSFQRPQGQGLFLGTFLVIFWQLFHTSTKSQTLTDIHVSSHNFRVSDS